LSAGAAQALAARADVASVQSDTVLQWIPRPDLMFRQPRNGPAAFGAPQGTNESFAFYFPDQWNMLVIQAPAAWTATPAGNGRLVCVLDTGIDPDHVDLAGRVDLTRSASFVEAEPTIQDFESHGTFVASIVSSNGLGIASVATDARLCAIKVIDATGSGSFADVIAGILFAADEGADAINLSLGAYVDLKERGVRQLVEALQRAVDFARRNGAVVVAAAGNDTINLDRDSHSRLLIPAQLHHVVSVGATAPFNQQHFDMLAGYSNFGGRTGISLVAPGGDFLQGGSEFDLILGACSHTSLLFPCSTSDFLLGAGTSFASPHVAGAVAVVASQLGHKARADRVTDCILRGADDVGPKAIFGAGRLNVANAAACSKPRGSRPLAAAN
jgi:subtilisin family serine protease